MAHFARFTFDDTRDGKEYTVVGQDYDGVGEPCPRYVAITDEPECNHILRLTPEDAIALAKWILREFGEGK